MAYLVYLPVDPAGRDAAEGAPARLVHEHGEGRHGHRARHEQQVEREQAQQQQVEGVPAHLPVEGKKKDVSNGQHRLRGRSGLPRMS